MIIKHLLKINSDPWAILLVLKNFVNVRQAFEKKSGETPYRNVLSHMHFLFFYVIFLVF